MLVTSWAGDVLGSGENVEHWKLLGKQRQKEKSKFTPLSSVAGDIWEWVSCFPGVMAVPPKRRSVLGGGQELGKSDS